MPLGPLLGRRRAGALPYEHTAPRERLRPAKDLAVESHYRAEPSRQAHLDLERLPGAGRPRDLEALDSRQVAGPAGLRVSPFEQQRRLRDCLGQKERRLPGLARRGPGVGRNRDAHGAAGEFLIARLDDRFNEAEGVRVRKLGQDPHAIFFCSMKSQRASTDANALTPTSSSSTLMPNSCSRPSTSSSASIESRPSPSPKSGASFWIVVGSMSSFKRRTIRSLTRGARSSFAIESPQARIISAPRNVSGCSCFQPPSRREESPEMIEGGASRRGSEARNGRRGGRSRPPPALWPSRPPAAQPRRSLRAERR